MDDAATLRMNLVAIQKVDPYAKEIIDTCSHVAYYKYITDQWHKTEIEGSFFIYSRVAEPFESIFINNRLSTTSLVEPIIKSMELQNNPPFLLYRNRTGIYGFWFYSKNDCDKTWEVLDKLIRKQNPNHSHELESAETSIDEPKEQQQQQQRSHQNGTNIQNKRDVDIFSMLSKAQAEFSNCGVTNVEQQFTEMSINKAQQQQQQQVPQQHHHQPLMKQMSNAMPDITSPNVVSFFAAAQQPTNGMVPVIDAKQVPPQFLGPSNCIPIAQPPMTVDQLEKQHRVTSKSPRVVEQNLLNNFLQPSGNVQQSSSPQPMNLLQQQQQPGISSNIQSQKPTLITPVMFQASNIEDKAILNAQQMTNVQGMSNNNNNNNNMRLEPLTQNQLMQALNYLLENDPEFIRKIHEAYIKSFNKMITL